MSITTTAGPVVGSSNPHVATTTLDTELRFLTATNRRKLTLLLDVADAWRDLAGVIEKPGGSGLLITSNHIRILEEQKHVQGSSPSKVLLDFWSTTGRRHERPTVGTLLSLLRKVRLERIASFVSQDILGLDNNGNPDDDDLLLSKGLDNVCLVDPSAPSPSDTFVSSVPSPSAPLEVEGVLSWNYSLLLRLTNNFQDVEVSLGGHKIGEGAFGTVFKAVLEDGKEIAIKQLKGDVDRRFLNEIQAMKVFAHQNLLPLIAISTDGPNMCLISEYMPRGSLNSFLAFHGTELCPDARISVAVGTARGLCHLHSFLQHPVVHRDVKSDNILLNHDLTPKLGDFGLTRVGSSGSGATITRSRQFTQNVIGTSVYMAPEAFRGDVSTKLDVFAFGIVLLELLTGLRPYDEKRSEPDLLTHVEEQIETEEEEVSAYSSLMDDRVTGWTGEAVISMFTLARRSTCQRKKDRPNMTEILTALQQI